MTKLYLSTPSETPGVPHWQTEIDSSELQSTVDSLLSENDELVLEIRTFES